MTERNFLPPIYGKKERKKNCLESLRLSLLVSETKLTIPARMLLNFIFLILKILWNTTHTYTKLIDLKTWIVSVIPGGGFATTVVALWWLVGTSSQVSPGCFQDDILHIQMLHEWMYCTSNIVLWEADLWSMCNYELSCETSMYVLLFSVKST